MPPLYLRKSPFLFLIPLVVWLAGALYPPKLLRSMTKRDPSPECRALRVETIYRQGGVSVIILSQITWVMAKSMYVSRRRLVV